LLSLNLHVTFAIINQTLNQNFAAAIFDVPLLISTIIPVLYNNVADAASLRQVLIEHIDTLQLVN